MHKFVTVDYCGSTLAVSWLCTHNVMPTSEALLLQSDPALEIADRVHVVSAIAELLVNCC